MSPAAHAKGWWDGFRRVATLAPGLTVLISLATGVATATAAAFRLRDGEVDRLRGEIRQSVSDFRDNEREVLAQYVTKGELYKALDDRFTLFEERLFRRLGR